MTQTERRLFLIKEMLKEQPQYSKIEIPVGEQEQKIVLRSLFNTVSYTHLDVYKRQVWEASLQLKMLSSFY